MLSLDMKMLCGEKAGVEPVRPDAGEGIGLRSAR